MTCQVGYFLTQNASMVPDRAAVVYRGQEMTYCQLNVAANRLANHLISMGIYKGQRVAFMIPNSLEAIVIWYATQKAALTAIPVNSRLLAGEIAQMLEESACTTLIYCDRFSDIVQDIRSICPKIQHFICKYETGTGEGLDLVELIAHGCEEEPEVDISGEDESAILYTSGTTGRSKGVVYTQQMVNEFSYISTQQNTAVGERNSILVQSPLFHLGGMQHIWRMSILGGTIVLVNKIIPEEFFENIEKHQVTELYILPPVLIRRLYDAPNWRTRDLSSVRRVLCAGGKCSMDIVDMIHELFPNSKLRLSYGSTETMGLTAAELTCAMIAERPELATTLGKPLSPKVELHLVDENGCEVPDNVPGEALVRSPMVTRSYINHDGHSPSPFLQDGWFQTGDVLRRTPDGYYFMVDRAKDMIKSGGENVFAQEVEGVLRDFPEIFDCAVIGIPDDEMGEGVAAAIVTYDNKPLEAAAFLTECRTKMPSYRKPRYWTFMKELPTNSVGKIQKSVLRSHPEWFERIQS